MRTLGIIPLRESYALAFWKHGKQTTGQCLGGTRIGVRSR